MQNVTTLHNVNWEQKNPHEFYTEEISIDTFLTITPMHKFQCVYMFSCARSWRAPNSECNKPEWNVVNGASTAVDRRPRWNNLIMDV